MIPEFGENSTGPAVAALIQFLAKWTEEQRLPYFVFAPGSNDYTRQVAKAMRCFQLTNGLNDTGICDGKTVLKFKERRFDLEAQVRSASGASFLVQPGGKRIKWVPGREGSPDQTEPAPQWDSLDNPDYHPDKLPWCL